MKVKRDGGRGLRAASGGCARRGVRFPRRRPQHGRRPRCAVLLRQGDERRPRGGAPLGAGRDCRARSPADVAGDIFGVMPGTAAGGPPSSPSREIFLRTLRWRRGLDPGAHRGPESRPGRPGISRPPTRSATSCSGRESSSRTRPRASAGRGSLDRGSGFRVYFPGHDLRLAPLARASQLSRPRFAPPAHRGPEARGFFRKHSPDPLRTGGGFRFGPDRGKHAARRLPRPGVERRGASRRARGARRPALRAPRWSSGSTACPKSRSSPRFAPCFEGRTLIATVRSASRGRRASRSQQRRRSDSSRRRPRRRLRPRRRGVPPRRRGRGFAGIPPSKKISSLHDLEGLPADLGRARRPDARDAGARFVKVVATANDSGDARRLLELQAAHRDGRLATFGMGEAGIATRALAPYLGAALAYGALLPGRATAPGQLLARDLAEIYGVGPAAEGVAALRAPGRRRLALALARAPQRELRGARPRRALRAVRDAHARTGARTPRRLARRPRASLSSARP